MSGSAGAEEDLGLSAGHGLHAEVPAEEDSSSTSWAALLVRPGSPGAPAGKQDLRQPSYLLPRSF